MCMALRCQGRPRPFPPSPAASRRDQLLATKLFAPPRPAGFVPRPRLVDRLNAGLSGGLMLVCAPAGYGKTALVAELGSAASGWLAVAGPRRQRSDAVLAPRDRRPRRGASWDRRAGRARGSARRRPPSMEEPVTLLINDLASRIRAGRDRARPRRLPGHRLESDPRLAHLPGRAPATPAPPGRTESRGSATADGAAPRGRRSLPSYAPTTCDSRVDETAALLRSALQLCAARRLRRRPGRAHRRLGCRAAPGRVVTPGTPRC